MIVGHVLGLPIEESLPAVAGVWTALTAVTVVALASLRQALRAVRRRSPTTTE